MAKVSVPSNIGGNKGWGQSDEMSGGKLQEITRSIFDPVYVLGHDLCGKLFRLSNKECPSMR